MKLVLAFKGLGLAANQTISHPIYLHIEILAIHLKMYGLQVSIWSLNLTYCFVFLAIAGMVFAFVQKANSTKQQCNYKDETKDSCYPPIEPLPHFDWKSEEPVKIRPFRPKYHLTMGMCQKPEDRSRLM